MSSPPPSDYFDVRSLLGEEERELQGRVRSFVDREVRPLIAKAFDDQRFPHELVGGIAELGLLGCTLEGYGCAGLNNVCYGLACQELERGDSALRSFLSVQGGLCMYPIFTYGSEQQKKKWLPPMSQGDLIGCFGLTEPGGGSDPESMQTRAVRNGDEWVLHGHKRWATNGNVAGIALVWARTEEGIRGFIVEKGTPGLEVRPILQKYSLRASDSSELLLNDVRVPDHQVLPGVVGLKGPLSCLTQARYGIAWGAIGAAIGCYEEVLEFSKTRELFGRPLSHTQTIQRRLAEMCRRITTAQLLALQLGRLKDRGSLHHSQVSLAKWNNVRAALDVARDARDMLGAEGIRLEYATIRHMLNLETVVTYEGTETIHELIVGRELTGVSSF